MTVLLAILFFILLLITPLGRGIVLAVGWLVSIITSLVGVLAIGLACYVLIVAAFG